MIPSPHRREDGPSSGKSWVTSSLPQSRELKMDLIAQQ
uniref:Uncharacterized protein n=1 Tax=Lepeophtheirus salmonis TaxID=72036 RepID=A0A0K2UIQ7_LEPSM